MAKRSTSKSKSKTRKTSKTAKTAATWRKSLRRFVFRAVIGLALVLVAVVLLYKVLNPPTTHTIWSESRRLGGVDHEWVNIEEIAPVMLRSAVAAEDANFCRHWGFDMSAIRAAIEGGARRGGSTITQQVVKNAYLWQARSWVRKALEAVMTPMTEALWSKQRILEVYLNIAEFDEGIFGVEAASRHYFGVGPEELSARQASLLAAVLPSPKKRNAARPSDFVSKRARSIASGAATIAKDERSACFEVK